MNYPACKCKYDVNSNKTYFLMLIFISEQYLTNIVIYKNGRSPYLDEIFLQFVLTPVKEIVCVCVCVCVSCLNCLGSSRLYYGTIYTMIIFLLWQPGSRQFLAIKKVKAMPDESWSGKILYRNFFLTFERQCRLKRVILIYFLNNFFTSLSIMFN